MNYATFLDDPNDIESLAVTFETKKYGETVDATTRILGGNGGLFVDEEYILFCWYHENLYYNIEKPTE